MITSERIATVLLRGEQQGWLERKEVDELCRELPPIPREALLKRIEIHGIEMRGRPAGAVRSRRRPSRTGALRAKET